MKEFFAPDKTQIPDNAWEISPKSSNPSDNELNDERLKRYSSTLP